MKIRITQRFLLIYIVAVMGAGAAIGQPITEGFNNISTLTASGWVMRNLSSPTGTTSWFQGNTSVFTAASGPANSYIAADLNNAGGTSGGTISNWLFTPTRTFKNGDTVIFYTRSAGSSGRADRLQVRFSGSDTSTNVGTTATSVGNFTTLIQEINATQVSSSYPAQWTQYMIVMTGFTVPKSGRLAFRYFNTNAGSAGTGGDYIGIDSFIYRPYNCPTFQFYPIGFNTATVGTAFSQPVLVLNSLDTVTFSSTGTLPPGLTLASNGVLSGTPTAAGVYSFTVSATDSGAGCTSTMSYSFTVGCNIIALSPPALLTGTAGQPYSQTVTQTGGIGITTFSVTSGTLPPGLTLSLGGVLSGTPTQYGTYIFAITATSSSGCTGTSSYTLTIGCSASVATLAPFTPVCSNGAPVTLTGGLPAGGVYSGTGVTSGMFNPNVGTQTITYTYTDQYSCANTATQIFTVRQAPIINFPMMPATCMNAAPITLVASSTNDTSHYFSGIGVTGSTFNPMVGTQPVKYVAYNQYGCRDSVIRTITVKDTPVVTLDTTHSNYCLGDPPDLLSGGLPVGGTYSGYNVNGNFFTPDSVGTFVITYQYTDTTGCSGYATRTINVIDCAHLGISLQGRTGSPAVTCFPNPTAGSLKVLLNNVTSGETSIKVISVEGKVVLSRTISVSAGKTETQLDLTGYPAGLYMLYVKSPSGAITTQRIVLK